MGAALRQQGIHVVLPGPASIYRPPAASTTWAASFLVPGEAEFKSRNKLPGCRCLAASVATAKVLEAVTAEIKKSAFKHKFCIYFATNIEADCACST